MTRAQLREELISIIVKASARGDGRTVNRQEAGWILANLAADDSSPLWDAVRQPSRDVLRKVVAVYRVTR